MKKVSRSFNQWIVLLAVAAVAGVVAITSSSRYFGVNAGSVCTPVGGWTEVANYTDIIETPAVGSDGTSLFSAGGFLNGVATTVAQRYDPATNIWSPLPNALVAVYASRGVFAPNTNTFYVFGGYNGSIAINNVQRRQCRHERMECRGCYACRSLFCKRRVQSRHW